MEYRSSNEFAKEWNIEPRSVRRMAASGKIPGAKRMGNTWLIPTSAVKPADRRTSAYREQNPHSDSDSESDDNRFIFPFYLATTYYGHPELLNEEEQSLYYGQLDYYCCNFPDSYSRLTKLHSSTLSTTIQIGCLYILCHLCIDMGLRNELLQYLSEVEMIFCKDFPHKKELHLLYTGIQIYVDRKNLPQEPLVFATQTFLPDTFAYGYVLYAYRLMLMQIRDRHIDFSLLEMICSQLRSTNITPMELTMHSYLATLYHYYGNQNMSKLHLYKTIELATQTGLLLVITQGHRFMAREYDFVLDQYPEDIRGQLIDIRMQVRKNYDRLFLNAQKSSYQELSDFELELTIYVAFGYSNKEIAKLQGNSESTISKRISIIYEKLGVHSRKQLSEHFVKSISNYTILKDSLIPGQT